MTVEKIHDLEKAELRTLWVNGVKRRQPTTQVLDLQVKERRRIWRIVHYLGVLTVSPVRSGERSKTRGWLKSSQPGPA